MDLLHRRLEQEMVSGDLSEREARDIWKDAEDQQIQDIREQNR